MKHTPGPWVVESKSQEGSFIISRPGRKDGTAFSSWWIAFVGPCLENDIANALLIAAAPDLLAACKALTESAALCFADILKTGNIDPINGKAYRLAKQAAGDAVAKATA